MADERGSAWIAAGAAMLMIAEHVAGKAVRDAYFLSTFGVAALPTMFVVAAVAGLIVVPPLARLLAIWGPARVVAPAFAASAVLLAGSAWLAAVLPRVAAVTVYLHVAAVNAILISWFWSLVNERFDPRAAKREMRRMVGGATFGGLVGGLIVERGAHHLEGAEMLLLLAGLHLACALAMRSVAAKVQKTERAPSTAGLTVLRASPYARRLALLVVVSTVSATFLDYLFKAEAAASTGGGPSLLRFFAVFYAGTGLATFLLGSLLSHVVLEKLGIARTVATLPAAVALGGTAALLVPGLASFTALRATEMSLHSSLWRSAYELFFNPMSPAEKRGVKTLIDVGFERLGDALGGGLLTLVLAVAAAHATPALLGASIALSLGVLALAVQLHRGYVRTLESRLREGAVEIDATEVRDSTTLSVLRSLAPLHGKPAPAQAPAPPASPVISDPLLERISLLRSADAPTVRRALASGPLGPPLVAHAIVLLAWDEVAPQAIAALARVADASAGQLLDFLLSPDEEFAVRRRVPRVLEHGSSARVIDGLLAGLDDPRFEVRFRCGHALARIHARTSGVAVDALRIFQAVRKETERGRAMWESQRLLDEVEGPDDFAAQANRSLEHVFTLLSLAFPRQPLAQAFRGLQADDKHLRGTALEYLEGVLPADVRVALWPFLEESGH